MAALLKNFARACWRTALPSTFRLRLNSTRWRLDNVWNISRGKQAVGLYRKYLGELKAYRKLSETENIEDSDLWPCLFDRSDFTPVPRHYFHQLAWVMRHISATRPAEHYDIGSQLELLASATAITSVVFVDIRPPLVNIPNLKVIGGSILKLPFPDASQKSVSCLHVIEHIGLGRYGDPLDPSGSDKAAAELARILGTDGNLFVSTPIGRERTCFNAHRVFAAETVLRMFEPLRLRQFCCEDDSGEWHEDVSPHKFKNANYSCGCFWFTK